MCSQSWKGEPDLHGVKEKRTAEKKKGVGMGGECREKTI